MIFAVVPEKFYFYELFSSSSDNKLLLQPDGFVLNGDVSGFSVS